MGKKSLLPDVSSCHSLDLTVRVVCVRVTGVKQCKDAAKIEGFSVRRTGRTLWARDLDGWRLAVCGVWCVVCGVPGLPWSMEGEGQQPKQGGKRRQTPWRELDSSLTWTPRVTRARERERCRMNEWEQAGSSCAPRCHVASGRG